MGTRLKQGSIPAFALLLSLVLLAGCGLGSSKSDGPHGPSPAPGPTDTRTLKQRALEEAAISDDVPDASDAERMVGDWDAGLAYWMPAFRIYARANHQGDWDLFVTGVSVSLGEFVGNEHFLLGRNGDGSLSATANLKSAPSTSLTLRFTPTADRDVIEYSWTTREGGVTRPTLGRARRVSPARAARMRAKTYEVLSQERLGEDERDCTAEELKTTSAYKLAVAGRDLCLNYLFQGAAPEQLENLFDESLKAMRKNADLRVLETLDENGLKEDAWAPKRARLLRVLVSGLEDDAPSACKSSRFRDGQTTGTACGVENGQREAVALFLLKDGVPLELARDDLLESWLGTTDPELAAMILDRAVTGAESTARTQALSRAMGKLVAKDNLWKGESPSPSEKLLDLMAKAPLSADSRASSGPSLLEAAIRAGDFNLYRALAPRSQLSAEKQVEIALSEIDAQIERTNVEADPEERNLIRAKLRGLRAIAGGLAERL
jgi:hypothetical protein